MEQTVDNAFQGSTLLMPQTPVETIVGNSHECFSFYFLLTIGLILLITQIKTLIGIVPSLVATAIRWKESLNLEASVSLSRDRNLVAICAIIPFILTIYTRDNYQPQWMATLGPNTRLWAIVGVLCALILVRTALEAILKPRRVPAKNYKAIVRVAYSFFIIQTTLLLLVNGICAIIGSDADSVRNAMLWVSALTYLLYLIRKMQIFTSSCSFFGGILYLCALEILPTGAVVASAVIF